VAPGFIAMGNFGSMEAFQKAFGPHADVIMADIPNYTDIQPTTQFIECPAPDGSNSQRLSCCIHTMPRLE
jgi:hypothetical protein